MKAALLAGVGILCISNPLTASDTGFIDAVKNGDAKLSLRMRYEDVNENTAVERGAQALTLRSRLSFETKQYELFSVLLEFDDVQAIPDDENFNTGDNGQLDDALVEDPEGSEINRIWLAYDIANTLIKYGQQYVALDNERFFGSEPWRQNTQTLSGLSIRNNSLNYTHLYFAQFNQLEGVQGEGRSEGRRDLNANIANIKYRGFMHSDLALYAYSLDSDYVNYQEDTLTYGVRFSGRIKNEPEIDYAFEYARQSDAGANTLNYSANYSLLDFGIAFNGARFGLGQEVLGADGFGYFVTPLASLHGFQGWTDQFQNGGLGNIAGGVRDTYFSVGYACSDEFHLTSIYHSFKSDGGPAGQGKLGSEWGVEAKYGVGNYAFKLKYADYSKDNFGLDTKKIWLTAEADF